MNHKYCTHPGRGSRLKIYDVIIIHVCVFFLYYPVIVQITTVNINENER